MRAAIIVGGAETALQEVAMAKELCHAPVYFVVNDMIGIFPERAIGVTLHAQALERWLPERAANGHPPLDAVWAQRIAKHVTNKTTDWRGSVGLQAVKVALETGHTKIILCGVPMLPQAKHFRRRQIWRAAVAFRPEWVRHKKALAPYVRSFSGWTRELLGYPTREWLNEQHPSFSEAPAA